MRDDRERFETLLNEVRQMHLAHEVLRTFCRFPIDITDQPVEAFHIPSSDLMQRETGLFTEIFASVRDAFVAAAPHAHWRETYKDTDIGQDFMDRFGCYCLIGDEGPFASATMRAWLVYMPAHLHYTWHQHPAEELYCVIAGQAEFLREGATPETLRAGQTSLHTSNQPHAMTTQEHPVMAYVVWRNGFETPPILTPS